MSFRLVGGSAVNNPAVVNLYASGTVHPGGVVQFDRGVTGLDQGYVSPASSGTTTTNVFGVSLDYAEGNSDTQVRVIPFVPGQLWEGDCISVINTVQIGKRHALSNATTPERSRLLQNTLLDNSGAFGIFLAYNVTGLSTGSGKLIGEFLRQPFPVGRNQTTFN